MATVGELEAKAVADTLANKLSEIKAETHGYTLGPVDSNTIGHAGAHASCGSGLETFRNTMGC